MKLLYITNGINGSGGLERVLSIKASLLADQYDYKVHILVLNNAHTNPFYEFSLQIKFHSINAEGHPINYFNSYKKGIQEKVNQIQPHIISVCDDGLKAFFLPYLLGKTIPIIYERHASINLNFANKSEQTMPTKIINRISYFLMKKLAAKFDAFVVLTNGNTKEWDSNNIRVIPNPLSFYPNEKAILSSRKVIAVGSHSFNKGYDLLLDAWKFVEKKYPNWQLHIYGKFDKNETFLHYANKLGVNNVMFYQPVSSIDKVYLDSSIMVLPSRSEGFGMVLIEAMACGLPCVAFNCPHGPADIITHEEDGFILPMFDVQGFGKAIIHLIEDNQLREKMGENAKDNSKRYLPEQIMPIWDSLFKSLIK